MTDRIAQDDDGYFPDADDPDYDLSEMAGYAGWEPRQHRWRGPLLIATAILLVASVLLPLVMSLTRVR